MDKMTEDKLQKRAEMLSKRLKDLEKSVGSLSKQLTKADSPDQASSLARQVGEAKQDIQTTEEAYKQVLKDIQAEKARLQSPEYKQALKAMEKIEADNKSRLKAIDKTFLDLQEQLEEFSGQCKDYDRLKRQHTGEAEPYGLIYSYNWIQFMKAEVDKMAKDYIYQTRKV